MTIPWLPAFGERAWPWLCSQSPPASFEPGGNHRDGVTDAVAVTFGGVATVFSIGPSDPFTADSVTASSAGGPLSPSFQDGRDGDIGALPDDVVIATSAVPEPANLPLAMTAGRLAPGFAARRGRR